MSAEFLKYDRYGSSIQAKFLIGQVLPCNKPKTYKQIRNHCLKESAKFGEPLFGLMKMFELISLIDRDDSDNIILRCDLHDLKPHLQNDYRFCSEFVKKILIKIDSLKLLDEIFPSEGIEYEKSIAHFTIKEGHIPIKYSGIKKMFIEYGMFEYDITQTKLVVSSDFRNLFEKEVIKKINHRENERSNNFYKKKSKMNIKKITVITSLLVAIGVIITGIYQFFKKPEESIDIKNKNIGSKNINVTGSNNNITVLESNNNKVNEKLISTEQNIKTDKIKNQFFVGQVFMDDLTSATLGVSYINIFNKADVIVNLPGEKQIKENEVSPGTSWFFKYKNKKYKLLLSEIQYSQKIFKVEVIEFE